VLILWLTLPRFKGATYLYEQVVAPYLSEYEGHIDQHLDSIGRAASAGLEQARAAGAQHVREHSVKMLTTIAGLVSPQGSGSTRAPALQESYEEESEATPAQPRARSAGKREQQAAEIDVDLDALDDTDASQLRQRRK